MSLTDDLSVMVKTDIHKKLKYFFYHKKGNSVPLKFLLKLTCKFKSNPESIIKIYGFTI